MGALVDGLSPSRRSDLLMEEDTKIKFRDSDIYIQSDSDGNIKIVADTGTSIEGTTDITGDTSITGDTTIVGDMSLRLTTADGSTKLSIEDSETVPIHYFDSNGNYSQKGSVKRI